MKMKKIVPIFAGVLVLAIVFGPQIAKADLVLTEGLGEFTQTTGLPETDLVTVIGNVVKVVIGFLGLVATIIIIIGGFQWMTSGGNEEKIGNAKKLMINGLIGLVICLLAYAIAAFVINILSEKILTTQ